jgi:hypothetical protein
MSGDFREPVGAGGNRDERDKIVNRPYSKPKLIVYGQVRELTRGGTFTRVESGNLGRDKGKG